MSTSEERVVLLDEHGRPCGEMSKAAVHHRRTPLHLAFSCWIRDEASRCLMTRRAAAKLTWPLAWSNAVCGHPAPGEDIVQSVRRRARAELGLTLTDLAMVLPHFRYRARMDNGIVENEICPVFQATVAAGIRLRPDPVEVADWRWLSMADLHSNVAADPDSFSPWMIAQLAELASHRLG